MTAATAPAISAFVDDGLGHSSYLVDLGDGTGLVIDPARLPTGQRDDARRRSLRIAYTADTHTHADYISGSPDLGADGATFLAPAEAGLRTPHRGLAGGDELDLGRFRLRAIATPGHTPDHLAYLLSSGGTPVALFSGGSLMVGTAGRTDLAGPTHAEELARDQYRSIQTLLALPDELAVYPTHGAGSFCAAPAGSARTTTIGAERATNPLSGLDEETFVARLLPGFGSLPAHFGRLPEVNRLGPLVYADVPELAVLPPADVAVLADRGATLVDVRPIDRHAAAHPFGAVSIQLRSVFANWAGWLVDPARPVAFVIDDDQDERDLVRQCLTVGIEDLAGRLDGGVEAWVATGHRVGSTPLVDPLAVAATVIDVRQRDEFGTGHLPDARNIELGRLADAEIPDEPITIMCGHGERAMTGASLLTAAGHREVTVLAGGPDTWAAATGHDLACE